MKHYLFIFLLFSFSANSQSSKEAALNKIAESYVRLGLDIGQYDGDFVDAYYGPDSLKPQNKKTIFPKDEFLAEASQLMVRLKPFTKATDKVTNKRAKWLTKQLIAFTRRIKWFAGEKTTFDIEAKELFDATPPHYTEVYFTNLLKQLDNLLKGNGTINERFQRLANRFIIPADKLDTVLKTAIAESQNRTKSEYALPANENFKLEYVSNKPWTGYNWYKGNYQSLIQYNTDAVSFVDKAIDIAAHEGYPGHHVYNTLLEKNIYRERGWIEISLYPLFSPQSLIAEGSANYGIEVAFPGEDKIKFMRNVLLPLANVDTTGITEYVAALQIRNKLQDANTEITRRLVNGKMTDAEALHWLTEYRLMNEKDASRALSFNKKYHSYVINYYYGQSLIRHFMESGEGADNNSSKRWKLFEWILSNELTASDLTGKTKK
jgi:hypothetical protein